MWQPCSDMHTGEVANTETPNPRHARLLSRGLQRDTHTHTHTHTHKHTRTHTKRMCFLKMLTHRQKYTQVHICRQSSICMHARTHTHTHTPSQEQKSTRHNTSHT